MQYPTCLFAKSTKYPFAQDGAIVLFYHQDFGYLPLEHFYTINNNYPDPNCCKYKKFLQILGSWLPLTIALIFVVLLSCDIKNDRRMPNYCWNQRCWILIGLKTWT